MNFESVVTNGQVVVDVGEAIPDGTAVQVTVSPAENPHAWMKKYIGQAKGLPPDFAAQHDHYRLGTPKR